MLKRTLLTTLLLPLSLNAAIINAHFEGFTHHYNQKDIVIDITFDTSEPTSNTTDYTNSYTGIDWLNYSLTIDNLTYDFDNLGTLNGYSMNEYTHITNNEPNANGLGYHDNLQIGVHAFANYSNPELSQYIYSYSFIDMLSLNENFLKSTSLEDLIYADTDITDTTFFSGFYHLHYREYDKTNNEVLAYLPRDFGSFDVTSYNFEIMNDEKNNAAEVNTPSTFSILAFALVFLSARKIRKDNNKWDSSRA